MELKQQQKIFMELKPLLDLALRNYLVAGGAALDWMLGRSCRDVDIYVQLNPDSLTVEDFYKKIAPQITQILGVSVTSKSTKGSTEYIASNSLVKDVASFTYKDLEFDLILFQPKDSARFANEVLNSFDVDICRIHLNTETMQSIASPESKECLESKTIKYYGGAKGRRHYKLMSKFPKKEGWKHVTPDMYLSILYMNTAGRYIDCIQDDSSLREVIKEEDKREARKILTTMAALRALGTRFLGDRVGYLFRHSDDTSLLLDRFFIHYADRQVIRMWESLYQKYNMYFYYPEPPLPATFDESEFVDQCRNLSTIIHYSNPFEKKVKKKKLGYVEGLSGRVLSIDEQELVRNIETPTYSTRRTGSFLSNATITPSEDTF